MCTYLAKRGSTYYFRRVIPAELRPGFGGRSEFMVSLGTKDREAAKRLIPARTAMTDRLLDDAAVKLSLEAPETGAGEATTPPPTLAPDDAAALSLAAQELALARDRAAVRQAARREARALTRKQMEAHAAQFSTADLDPYHAILKDIMAERAEVAAAFQPIGTAPQSHAPAAPQGTAVPLLATFDAYAAEAQIKPAGRTEWRAIVERLIAFLGHDDAARITADDLYRWTDTLLQETTARGVKRDPGTVRGKHLGAIRGTLGWAREKRKLPANVALDVVIRVPKKPKLRERDFTPAEARAVLSASLVSETDAPSPDQAFARRWIPWLCAYTGARVNEISQLRGDDLAEREGMWTVRITPEAGTVKANAARVVPLHADLTEQGFVAAAKARGAGPLFYNPSRQRVPGEGNRQYKKVGERLAAWVRSDVGITDPGLAPNHAWRHTFKTLARLHGIDEQVADAIQGHAPASVGRRYGSVPLQTMANAIARLPRLVVSPKTKL